MMFYPFASELLAHQAFLSGFDFSPPAYSFVQQEGIREGRR
jgi:hypothetical protein